MANTRSLRVVCVLATLLAASCGDASSSGPPRSTASDARVVALRIEPATAKVDVLLGAPPPTIGFRALARSEDGVESDVTGRVVWASDRPRLAAVVRAGELLASDLGGHANVGATLDGFTAAAPLTLTLRGDVFGEGTMPGADDAAFAKPVDGAPLVVEYPPEGVVVPADVAPLAFQWSALPAGRFRARVTSSDVLDVIFHTARPELTPAADLWSRFAETAPDEPIVVAVEGADGVTHGASAPRSVTITSERLLQGAIYAHDCDVGGLVVVDGVAGAGRRLATTSPSNLASEQRIGHCTGCHSVARDGRRIGFSRLDDTIDKVYFGALRYDTARSTFVDAVPPDTIVAPSSAFSPLEATTPPAMLTAYSIVAQSLSGIALLDPETGKSLPSDLPAMLAAVPAELGRGASHPAWSSGGGAVAFTAWPNTASPAGQPQVAPDGSIVEATVAYVDGSFHFGAPKVVVRAVPGESNDRASFDDDDVALAFQRSKGSGTPGSVSILRRADGKVLPLAAAGADPAGTWDSRLPSWGPVTGPRWTWMVVSSTRPYGHLRPEVRPQLWVFAVDRKRLAAGDVDPSAPAFWVPGQELSRQYTAPQWPRAMLSAP